MATYYWVGGTGTWNTTNTANWSLSSGGTGGAGRPASTADNAIFDSLSGGAGTVVTFAAGPNIATVTVGGDIQLSLQAAFSATNLEIRNAYFYTNNYSVSVSFFNSNNSFSRVISLGSSSLTVIGTFNLSDTTNLTFNAGTSQITLTSANPIFNGGGLVYYDVFSTSNTKTLAIITGINTFNNLNITGRSASGAVGVSVVRIDDDQTINGTLTLSAGINVTTRTFVQSNIIGFTRTLTCAAVAPLVDIDFRDIAIAGAAAPISGTSLGDGKGNSNIMFPDPKTVYWRNSTSATWGNLNIPTWSLTPGGTASNSAFPLAQDTAVFTETYPNSGATVTLNSPYNISTIDMSQRTSNLLLTIGGAFSIYGDWINGTGTIIGGTAQLTFAGRGSQTITSAGKQFTAGITIDSPEGSVTLLDALSTNRSSTGALTINQGVFSANNYNVTLSGSLSSIVTSGSLIRTIAIGSGTWSIIGGSICWNASTSTNLTITGTGTINLNSAAAKTFAGGDIKTYPTINQGSSSALTISGSNKFANITNTAVGPVRFTGGTTNEFDQFNLNGTSISSRLTLGSTNTTQAILKKPTAWNVGTGSSNNGNNTGLSFTAGDNDFLAISYINGQISTSVIPRTNLFFLLF